MGSAAGRALFGYVTAQREDEAWRIGRAVVEARLAACANVLVPMRSLYWWQGKLEEAHQAVLVLKTTETAFEALSARVEALHSHACPCVVRCPSPSATPSTSPGLRAKAERAPGEHSLDSSLCRLTPIDCN